MFFGFKDSCLMKADSRSVNGEIEEDNVGIPCACRQPEMRRQ